jgi:hypothetical protein
MTTAAWSLQHANPGSLTLDDDDDGKVFSRVISDRTPSHVRSCALIRCHIDFRYK